MKTQALAALAVVLALDGASAQSTTACPDDFATPRLGEGHVWTFLDRDNAAGGAAQVAGGRLELSGRGEDIFRERNHFVAVYRKDIPGDFDVAVRIDSQTETHAWAQAGILVANDAEDLKRGGYFVLDVSPGNALNAFYDARDSAGQLETHLGSVGRTTYPIWLRVRKADRKFSAWYKNTETEAWKVVAENISPQLTAQDSHIALFSVSHDAAKTATTVFDDFACLHEPPTALARPRGEPQALPEGMGAAGAAGRVDAAGRASPGMPAALWRAGR
jgi:hypothetical protein